MHTVAPTYSFTLILSHTRDAIVFGVCLTEHARLYGVYRLLYILHILCWFVFISIPPWHDDACTTSRRVCSTMRSAFLHNVWKHKTWVQQAKAALKYQPNIPTHRHTHKHTLSHIQTHTHTDTIIAQRAHKMNGYSRRHNKAECVLLHTVYYSTLYIHAVLASAYRVCVFPRNIPLCINVLRWHSAYTHIGIGMPSYFCHSESQFDFNRPLVRDQKSFGVWENHALRIRILSIVYVHPATFEFVCAVELETCYCERWMTFSIPVIECMRFIFQFIQ